MILKILNVCFSDIQGGAPIACYRLHQSLLSVGVDSKILVQQKTTSDKDVFLLKIINFKILYAEPEGITFES